MSGITEAKTPRRNSQSAEAKTPRRNMLKKLRNRLLLVNMIAIAVVVIVSFSVIYVLSYANMQKLNMDRLRSIPSDVMSNSIISMEVVDGNEPKSPSNILINPSAGLPIDYTKTFVVHVDPRDIVYVFSQIDIPPEVYMTAAVDAAKLATETGFVEIEGKRWAFLISGRSGENIIFYNIEDTQAALRMLLIGMIAVAIIVLGAMLLVSTRIANRAIRPVEESIEKQRRFVADASHELKTPLAIIDSNREVLLSGADETIESQRSWIDRIGEESERMRGLIDRMLYLAKAEDVPLPSVSFDISEAAEDGIRRVETILYERGVQLKFAKHVAPIPVKADAERIREVMLILLDNAVKYTDEGGQVTVETGRTKHHGYVRVSNTGAGIPKEDLPRIFERFYRVDKSRTSGVGDVDRVAGTDSVGGYGLGLSIAKTIVERSGGKITAASGQGLTTFTIELPIYM
jgi:signal transduction histidine kinase